MMCEGVFPLSLDPGDENIISTKHIKLKKTNNGLQYLCSI
jgi:hypothetical protein